MKKVLIISSFFLIILVFSTVGYKIVSANTKIEEIDDIITHQESKEKYMTHYNYTLDNPNIIINPYEISPLTALIIFETPNEEEVEITIKGKDKDSTYTNKFNKTKEHYIPVLGLYTDYNNEVIIKCGKDKQTYKIKTNKLPEDLKLEKKENKSNKLYIFKTDKYIYAIDNNNEVRWYLKAKNQKEISKLENGNLLISTDELIDEEHPKGLLEINLLGKIYHEYDIPEGYYGSYAETKETLLVLSKNITEINKQNGKITRNIKIDDNYNSISYENSNIILKNDKDTLEISYTTEESRKYESTLTEQTKEMLLPLYNNNDYIITKGLKFSNNKTSKVSKDIIWLINYKKTDSNYNRHSIKITKESDRLVISINLKAKENAYLILDKFLDKKIYDLKDGYNYINKNELKGDYSIYIKIDKNIYKTNKFVSFEEEKNEK